MRAFADPRDIAACRVLLRDGSRSFDAAARLLPSRVRDPAVVLYAFCRQADDEIDGRWGDGPADDGIAGGEAALAVLGRRLDGIYGGWPDDTPVDRAMAGLVATFAIPRVLPDALLGGFAWDAAGRRYETLSDVLAYAARVAGTVGAMMALLMGAREAVARACDLGVAMQLSNIARDVGEDARRGRLYLPEAWLRDAGIDPQAFLAAPASSPALLGVVRALLEVADALYARADRGIGRLPWDCRPGIFAARYLYAGIGRRVAAGVDPVATRAVVPPTHKLLLLSAAAGRALVSPAWREVEPLAETRFLVDAVRAWPHARPRPRRVSEQAIWVLELFDSLARRAMPAPPGE